MTDENEHGLDLAAIRKRMGSHSIFGPSSAAMWGLCSGSLIPNLSADDTANEDAAYGTVGHSVAEIWLKRIEPTAWGLGELADDLIDAVAPVELIGTTQLVVEGSGRSFEIEIDEDMLDHVRRYIVWCMDLPGQHYVEQRVDISPVTPIPDQSGTADHAACRPGLLIVTDLKMGKGVMVYAHWNYQGLLYALGFFFKWDHLYDFQRIRIRIAQPRKDHWDEFEISREELLEFAEWIKGRAALAWQPNAPRTPGAKQCQWCKVAGSCAANAAWLASETDDAFDDLDAPDDDQRSIVVGPDGTIEGVSYSVVEMQAVEQKLIAGEVTFEPREPEGMSTAALEKLLPHRRRIERFFEAVEVELESRALAGEELTDHKLVTGRAGRRAWRDEKDAAHFLSRWGVAAEHLWKITLQSPAQIEPWLKKAGFKKAFALELLDSLVVRPAGRSTLVQIKDDRSALAPPGEDFDNLDEL